MEASVILDVWELISEQLPTARKEDVANKLIKIFIDNGYEEDDLGEIKGEDTYIDMAIENFGEYSDDEEYDYTADDYEND